jgi:hypothetical protein
MAWHDARRGSMVLRACSLAALMAMLPIGAAAAPAPDGVPGTGHEPLECWWRTTVSAIRVGEPFGLVLTCAAVQTDSLTVAVDRGRLDAKAIELPPFEVLGGTSAPDLREGNRVFFQHEYTLRFVNDAFFNQDIPLPSLTVVYRLRTRAGTQQAATEGMEQRFAMPHATVRVVSLVPASATDIRDASATTFADVYALAARGRLVRAAGMSLTALGGLILLVGLVRTVAGRATAPSARSGLASNATILRGVVRELRKVESDRDPNGWTSDLAGRALTGARIVAAMATSGAVSQQRGDRRAAATGAFQLRQRWLSPGTVLVSASTTAKTLGHEIAQRGDGRSASIDLPGLQRALAEFTAAAYGDQNTLDGASLDGSLSTVRALARRLMIEERWPIRHLAPVIRRIQGSAPR